MYSCIKIKISCIGKCTVRKLQLVYIWNMNLKSEFYWHLFLVLQLKNILVLVDLVQVMA